MCKRQRPQFDRPSRNMMQSSLQALLNISFDSLGVQLIFDGRTLGRLGHIKQTGLHETNCCPLSDEAGVGWG